MPIEEQEEPRFIFSPMTERDAQIICSWRYDPPYDRYNWESWETLACLGKELADPQIRSEQYRSALLNGELSGFIQLFPMAADSSAGVIRLGLGLRPELCGRRRGIGAALARFAANYIVRLYPGWTVDLEVSADNLRAIAAYQRAGFTIDDTYELPTPKGPAPTHCMIWNGR
jgi:[ribosomal protein S18]-alanine N-acetyltransferase